MPLEKGVLNVGQLEGGRGHAARNERLGSLEAVTEFSANDVPADKPLVAAQADVRWIVLGIGSVVGVDVDQLDDPVRARPGR